jgi:hypothetical protein
MVNPQIQSSPVLALPFLYISGLNLSVASTTVLAIAPGQARDMNDVIDMAVGFSDLQGNVGPAPLFINTAVNGANGLDQGALAVADQYSVWLIGDSRGYLPVAGIMSLATAASPLLPLGYDSMRLIGYVSSVASALDVASVRNSSSAKASYLLPAVSVLAGGNAVAFAAVNLAAAITVPSLYNVALLTVNFTPLAAGDTVQLRRTGSTTTAGLVTIVGVAAGVPQQNLVAVEASIAPSIDYKVSVAGDSVSLLVSGYIATPV